MIEKILKASLVTFIYLFMVILISKIGKKLNFTSSFEEILYFIGGIITAWMISDVLINFWYKKEK